MMELPKVPMIFGTVLVTLLVLWAASALLSRLFVRRWIRRLLQSIGKDVLPHYTRERATHLPAPIQRYLQFALTEGHPNIRYAILRVRARFRHGANRPWFTVTAKEYLSGMEPGFVWDAVLKHNLLWWRTAKLSFLHGKGHGHLKLYGAITLRELEGAETDHSMLFRFLSDLVWLPTGLLPTKALRWESIDEHSARAVLVDGSTQVEATFHVNAQGEVERITTNSKYRDHRSGFEQTQFTLECTSYQKYDGVMIPTHVNFVWNLPEGDFTYGQFQITRLSYYYL